MASTQPQSKRKIRISRLCKIFIILFFSILIIPGCKTEKAEDIKLIDVWPEVVRALVKENTKTPSMILLIPEDVFNGNAAFAALTVPAGPSGFDNFAALAFLPDDDPPNGDQEPDDGDNGDDDNGGDSGDGGTNQNGDDNGSTSPFDGWPPPTGPNPTEDELDEEFIELLNEILDGELDELLDEVLDEMLDEALEKAFEDDEPGDEGNGENGNGGGGDEDDGGNDGGDAGDDSSPENQPGSEEGGEEETETPIEEAEDGGRIRLKAYYKVDPTNLPIPWWDTPPDSDLPLPKPIELPEFDRYPRFKDLDEGSIRPPWWPLGKPWPPRTYGFPNEWRPNDSGFKLGDWRIYISPLPSNNN